MISQDERRDFLDEVQDEEYRHEFVSEHVTVGLAFQIHLLREARGWTQEELASRCDMAQETISRLEDPNYGRYTLKTLKRLAKTFDVGLLVRFVSFWRNWENGLLTCPLANSRRQATTRSARCPSITSQAPRSGILRLLVSQIQARACSHKAESIEDECK